MRRVMLNSVASILLLATLVLISLAAPRAMLAQQPAAGHVVQAGDTLSAIAARFGTTPQAIMQANGLQGSLIYPGQYLINPAGGSGAQSMQSAGGSASPAESCAQGALYVLRQGDSLSLLASRWGVPVAAIKRANGLVSDTVWAGQSISMTCASPLGAETFSTAFAARTNGAPGCAGAYVVRPGDSLTAIAARCGVTVTALKSTNGLVSNWLLVGQSLRIPAGDASTRVR